jgi:hypothetical protein
MGRHLGRVSTARRAISSKAANHTAVIRPRSSLVSLPLNPPYLQSMKSDAIAVGRGFQAWCDIVC